jgi:hypothetical protein
MNWYWVQKPHRFAGGDRFLLHLRSSALIVEISTKEDHLLSNNFQLKNKAFQFFFPTRRRVTYRYIKKKKSGTNTPVKKDTTNTHPHTHGA